jgi:hypothetical protein
LLSQKVRVIPKCFAEASSGVKEEKWRLRLDFIQSQAPFFLLKT